MSVAKVFKFSARLILLPIVMLPGFSGSGFFITHDRRRRIEKGFRKEFLVKFWSNGPF